MITTLKVVDILFFFVVFCLLVFEIESEMSVALLRAQFESIPTLGCYSRPSGPFRLVCEVAIACDLNLTLTLLGDIRTTSSSVAMSIVCDE